MTTRAEQEPESAEVQAEWEAHQRVQAIMLHAGHERAESVRREVVAAKAAGMSYGVAVNCLAIINHDRDLAARYWYASEPYDCGSGL